ncbi:MAG: CooT family nickel-binding protein [Thermodesulfobacteria bacterium]|nr:CooT family nickel-binding protein [Thermodesulfobacteriota bacterium]
MCQPKVYLISGGEEKEILRDVIKLRYDGEEIVLETLFEGETRIKGRLKEIDFLKAKVVIEDGGKT